MSRAYLGKKMTFRYKWLKKPVFHLECNVEPEVLAGVSVLDALHRLHRVLLSRADVRTQRSGGLEILFKALGIE